MKKLFGLLLLLLTLTACSAQYVEVGVRCWDHRICTGDIYYYDRAPVTVVVIRGDRCRVRERDGGYRWVYLRDIRDRGEPRHRYYDEHEGGYRHRNGHYEDHIYRGEDHHDNGRHRGHYK